MQNSIHSLDKTFICEKLSKCSVVVVVVFLCFSSIIFFMVYFFVYKEKKFQLEEECLFFKFHLSRFLTHLFFFCLHQIVVFSLHCTFFRPLRKYSLSIIGFLFSNFFFNFTNATLTLKEVCQKIVMHVVMRPSTCLVNFQKSCLFFQLF